MESVPNWPGGHATVFRKSYRPTVNRCFPQKLLPHFAKPDFIRLRVGAGAGAGAGRRPAHHSVATLSVHRSRHSRYAMCTICAHTAFHHRLKTPAGQPPAAGFFFIDDEEEGLGLVAGWGWGWGWGWRPAGLAALACSPLSNRAKIWKFRR